MTETAESLGSEIFNPGSWCPICVISFHFFYLSLTIRWKGSNRAKGQTKDLVGKMMLTCGIPASIALRVERKVGKMNQLADCSGPCRLFIAYEVL